MAPHADFDTGEVRDKARRDLLYLLETVRGKKNLVIEESLAGPIGTIAKVSTLQDYGVDKFFFLENANTDTSQRNVIFVARGECGRHAQNIAGAYTRPIFYHCCYWLRTLLIRISLFTCFQTKFADYNERAKLATTSISSGYHAGPS